MNMNRIMLCSIALILILPAFSAQAFDDYRRGFILGLGVGTYESTVTNESLLFTSQEQTVDGTTASIRIGGGVSDHLLMYWFYDYGSHEEIKPSTALKTDISVGFTGLGMSVYITPRSHSVYFNGAVGVACSVEDDNIANNISGDEYCGNGRTLGIGVELGAGASLELNQTFLTLENETNSDLKKEYETTRMLFVYTWY